VIEKDAMPRNDIKAPQSQNDEPQRSPTFADFVGQDSLKRSLRYFIERGKNLPPHVRDQRRPGETRLDWRIRTEPMPDRSILPPHMLLCGPDGGGKATFANAIANEIGGQYHAYQARSANTLPDLVGILTKLSYGDVFALLDIDAIPDICLGYLATAIEDFKLVATLDQGAQARTVTIPIQPFTLIGTTARPSRVDRRLSKWMTSYDLSPYTPDDMRELLSRIALSHGFSIAEDASKLLTAHSEFSPQIAGVLLKRIKAHGFVDQGHLSFDAASNALRHLGYAQPATNSRDLIRTLRAMAGTEFEGFVADVFRRAGYSAELTPTTGDHGIDVILRKDGQEVVVQCKQWDGAIGEPVLRDFYGSMVALRADAGFVVTTSNFTSQAEAFAKDKPISLYDIDAIVALCLRVGKLPPGSTDDELFHETE
jgi:Holliday junction resolvasome RuvABC ATP-dependent DNA helicase subunit